MSAPVEKFTLRPQEKRILAGIGIVLFIMFNIWFVWPRFQDWGKVQKELNDLRQKRESYEKEIKKLPEYQQKLKDLQPGLDAAEIAAFDQTVEFRRKVEQMALTGNITVQNMSGPNKSAMTVTNQFFEEWNLSMQIVSGEKDLVDFLYHLSDGASTIRVRDLRLSQGPNFTNLSANVVLVANYQRATAAASKAPAPGKK